MPVSATQKRCLIISQNGDGENLQNILAELGLTSFTSGTGWEGVNAIYHYNPGVIILFFHAGNEEDTIPLRAVQALCRGRRSLSVAMVISSNAQVAKRLLGLVAKNGRCQVLPDLSPDLPKAVMAALSNQKQRPHKVVRAASA